MPGPTGTTKPLRSVLRAAGSLRFAGLLLVLLLVAMACATVFETTHGTEQALACFYGAWWFELLGVLLAVNMFAAVVVRYPFSPRQIGFVLTHLSVVVTLAGVVVSRHWGIDGQVRVLEGQTVQDLRVHQDALTLVKRSDKTRASIDLPGSALAGFQPIDRPAVPPFRWDNLRIEIERYLPDSVETQRVVNDSPHDHAAIEVSLSAAGQEAPRWVFAGQTAHVGLTAATFRLVPDQEELRRLLAETPATRPASKGTVRVDFEGTTIERPLAECLDQAVPIGDTGHTFRVLRYLPHAMVGEDNKLRSASDQPVNPAIEVEVEGPAGKVKHLAFAKFPDFQSMHGAKHNGGLKVTFVAAASDVPTVPVEVLGAADGELYVRFAPQGGDVTSRKLTVGTPVETPWPELMFTVLRRFDHARVERLIEPVDPVRQDRRPALLLKIDYGAQSSMLWVQKYIPYPMVANGETYEVAYTDKAVPLGFELTLNDFEVGHYPGTKRPRSFESHVSVFEPGSGRKQSQVISMNHPATFGGYTFYQSSYDEQAGQTASVLSVSWDPGQPIVFAGYIGMLAGMLWLLVTRMRKQRKAT